VARSITKSDRQRHQSDVVGGRPNHPTFSPNTTYLAASANPPLSSGPNPLVWNLGTNTADIPGVVSSLTTNTFSATTNTFDTYLDESNRIEISAAATNLVVSGNNGHERRPLVRFDLSSIPTSGSVSSARLTLTKLEAPATAARNVGVYRLTNAGRKILEQCQR